MDASMDKTRQQPGGPLAVRRPMLSRWVATSIALHLSVLGLLLYTRPPQLMPVEMPGDRTGHLLSLTYSPGNSAPSSTLQAPARPAMKAVPTKSIAAPNPSPSAPAAPAASTSTAAATGADALGDGDTTLALVVSHPPPHPDLAQLPAGTRGDVIVDVVIDKTGRIAKFTMTHGLGHGVDESVLATIQQWTFQPATRNGVPVASEQELLFHYERG
jgi:protein TonB